MASNVIDIKDLILLLRDDVRVVCESAGRNAPAKFMDWLLSKGLVQYPALAADPDLVSFVKAKSRKKYFGLTKLQEIIYLAREDVRATFSLESHKQEFLLWFYTFGLNEHKFWPLLTNEEKDFVRKLPHPWADRLVDIDCRLVDISVLRRKNVSRTFGVNVIGYAFGQLGIGEDARMCARALLAVKVPVSMVAISPGASVSQNDHSMQQHVVNRGDYAFNIFCLTAEETGRYYAEHGPAQFFDRYNIGYWPWELGAWPDAWQRLFALVDEVWVSSQHTFDALAPVCEKPLFLMPMAVDLGHVTRFDSRSNARVHFGLPVRARLFCFSFDLNSYIHRKNPQACIAAFQAAFNRRDYGVESVGLVIKVYSSPIVNEEWSTLKRLAKRDKRIHFIEQTLDRPELLALYQACDCFVSLHRAEGFGRGLAEALQLGLRVICTGYSGNVDFCHGPTVELVDYFLVKVDEKHYPQAMGQYWAEPSIEHAAQLMRKVFYSPKLSVQYATYPEFSPLAIGRHYKKRLKDIFATRSNNN